MAESGKYYPVDEELQILVPYLIKYHNSKKRSVERKAINEEAFKLLQAKNPSHWSITSVRLWFNNNKSKYMPEGGNGSDDGQPDERPSSTNILAPPADVSQFNNLPDIPQVPYQQMVKKEQLSPQIEVNPQPTNTNNFNNSSTIIRQDSFSNPFSLSRYNSYFLDDLPPPDNISTGDQQLSKLPITNSFPQPTQLSNQQNSTMQPSFNQQSPSFNQPPPTPPMLQTPNPPMPMMQQFSPQQPQLMPVMTPPQSTPPPMTPPQQFMPNPPQPVSTPPQIPTIPPPQPFKEPYHPPTPPQPLQPPQPPQETEPKNVIKLVDPNNVPEPAPQQNKIKFQVSVQPVDEDEDESQKKDEFSIPEPPTLAENQSLEYAELDSIKFNGYNFLSNMFECIRKVQKEVPSASDRLAYQNKMEANMMKFHEIFHNILNISTIECVDRTGVYISNQGSKSIQRQVSTTTALYTTGKISQSKSELVDTAPNIQAQKTALNRAARAATQMEPFYSGRGEFSSQTLKNVEAAGYDDQNILVYCQYNSDKQLSEVHYKGEILQLDVISPPTSISVDEAGKKVWIAADVRVHGFPLDDFSPDGDIEISNRDTLCIKNREKSTEIPKSSSLAVTENNIFLAALGKLYSWSKSPRNDDTKQKPLIDQYKHIPKEYKYDDSRVFWTSGRGRAACIEAKIGDDEFTMLAAISNDRVVAASPNYPILYIYNSKFNVVEKILGHTEGITSLQVIGNHLITSSKDGTVRVYDRNTMENQCHVDRTYSRTSAFFIKDLESSTLLAVGGMEKKNAFVMLYDMTKKCSLCEIKLDEGLLPTYIALEEDNLTLKILARTIKRTPDDDEDAFLKADVEQRANATLYTVKFSPKQ